jgi:hypothetical protein
MKLREQEIKYSTMHHDASYFILHKMRALIPGADFRDNRAPRKAK